MSRLSELRNSELGNSHIRSANIYGKSWTEEPVGTLLGPQDSAEFKVQTSQNDLERVISVSAQDQSQNQLVSPGLPTSSSELSPALVSNSVSSGPTPNALESKALSLIPVEKSTPVNAFNWRKYGQKQVKNPQGSRSYYRCTYSNCKAKKIECSDESNHMVEIISKGEHNHDPPKRTSCARDSRLALSATPDTLTHSLTSLNDKDSSTLSRGVVPATPAPPETKRDSSIDSDGTGDDVKEEQIDALESQERTKKSKSPHSESLSNDLSPTKKAKVVVRAAGDVGISGDGYRWRKYGQKMVKGNPHPRNYYRCTSSGCPVRKHIETSPDNESAVIITYKGMHDHNMPIPKKKHSAPSSPPDTVATPASVENSQMEKTETGQNQVSTTQWSVDTDSELMNETLGPAEEKVMESARTLLSIGFEIKQH